MKSGPIPQVLISSALPCEKQTMARVVVGTGRFATQSWCFYFTMSLMFSIAPYFFPIFYGLLTVLLPWNNKHVSWGGNRCRGPTPRTNYITRKDRMKGSSVTHAPTPLKHGWLVLKVGKSVPDVNVVVYLFLPLSSLPPSPLFPFQSSTSPFLVLTHSSRQARFYRTLKHKQEHPQLIL